MLSIWYFYSIQFCFEYNVLISNTVHTVLYAHRNNFQYILYISILLYIYLVYLFILYLFPLYLSLFVAHYLNSITSILFVHSVDCTYSQQSKLFKILSLNSIWSINKELFQHFVSLFLKFTTPSTSPVLALSDSRHYKLPLWHAKHPTPN